MKNPGSWSNLPVILSWKSEKSENVVLLWFVSYEVHWVLTREFWVLTFDKLLRLSRWEKDVFATKRLNHELLKILNWEITGLNNDSLDDMWLMEKSIVLTCKLSVYPSIDISRSNFAVYERKTFLQGRVGRTRKRDLFRLRIRIGTQIKSRLWTRTSIKCKPRTASGFGHGYGHACPTNSATGLDNNGPQKMLKRHAICHI